jgi:hypothetical protein
VSKKQRDDADDEAEREDADDEAEREDADDEAESEDAEPGEAGDEPSDDDDGGDDDEGEEPGDHEGDEPEGGHATDAHDEHEEVALEPDKPPNALIFVAIAAVCASVVGFVVLSSEWFNAALRAEHEKNAVGASTQLRELRVLEDKKLGSHAWVSQGQNIVRIPLDRALELTLRDWKARPKDAPPEPPKPAPKAEPQKNEGCDFDGKRYATGDTFKADCNTCRCDKYDDKYLVACTELACGVKDEKAEAEKVDKDSKADECSYADAKHAIGATFKAKNGCDQCRCEKVGDKAAVLCTKLACDAEKADPKKDEKKDGDKADPKKDEKKAP